MKTFKNYIEETVFQGKTPKKTRDTITTKNGSATISWSASSRSKTGTWSGSITFKDDRKNKYISGYISKAGITKDIKQMLKDD